MSERKAVIKNADMSRCASVASRRVRGSPTAFAVGENDALAGSSPRSPRSSARPSLASSGETRRLGHDPRLTSLFRALPALRDSQELQLDAIDCATQVRISGPRPLWTFTLSTFRLTAAMGTRVARDLRSRRAQIAALNPGLSSRVPPRARPSRAPARLALSRRARSLPSRRGSSPPPLVPARFESSTPAVPLEGSSAALIPSRILAPLAPPSSSGSREVQHREGHRRVHQEGVRQEVQPHLALHRRPQLRLLRHARGEALHLLLPRSGRGAPLQVRLNPARSGSAGLNQ